MSDDIRQIMNMINDLEKNGVPEEVAEEVAEETIETVVEDESSEYKYNLRDFVDGYLVCALWSSSDVDEHEGEVELDNYVYADITKAALTKKATAFFEKHAELIGDYVEESGKGYDYAGHTFWLSHNGHGVDFTDNTNSDVATALSQLADEVDQIELYLGDDELVYASGYERSADGVKAESNDELTGTDVMTEEVDTESAQVCDDCFPVIVNDDPTHLSATYDEDEAADVLMTIRKGISKLTAGGGTLSAGESREELSTKQCECCGSRLAGERFEVVITTNR